MNTHEAPLAAEHIARFVTAGNARFTLMSVATGVHFTYRVRHHKENPVAFVSLLTGPDNEQDYQYIGYVRDADGRFRHGGVKARAGFNAPGVRALTWFSRHQDSVAVKVYHEGRCGRCGRTLTVPSSIESGLGPVCAGRE